MKKERIAWLSAAPWAATGYGVQTALWTTALVSAGYPIAVYAYAGLEGNVIPWNNIPVYPRGYGPFGADVVGPHSKHFNPDLIVSLVDAWVLDPSAFDGYKWCPWFPVDCEPLPPRIAEIVRESYQPIVFSRFGEQMMQQAGIDARYIPLGIDARVYTPGDQRSARERIGLPKDVWIVGIVAANQQNPSRKAFPQQIEAFAKFHERHPETLLYLHTTKAENNERNGVNLVELCDHFNLIEGKDVVFANEYINYVPYSEPAMVDVYRSLDILLNVSMAEGFGVPVVEAQSCGVPVIVGDWTSMPELLFAGWKVERENADRWWTPLGSFQYLPRVSAIAEVLETAYGQSSVSFRAVARRGASEYHFGTILLKYWIPLLQELRERGHTGDLSVAASPRAE